MDDFKEVELQKTDYIFTGNEYLIPNNCLLKLEKLVMVNDYPEYQGQRAIVMAHTTSKGRGKEFKVSVAIASFIIGKDYEQNINILLNPSDQCFLELTGPNIVIQLQYSTIEQ